MKKIKNLNSMFETKTIVLTCLVLISVIAGFSGSIALYSSQQSFILPLLLGVIFPAFMGLIKMSFGEFLAATVTAVAVFYAATLLGNGLYPLIFCNIIFVGYSLYMGVTLLIHDEKL